jgi:C4-dicarboxylate-specific signal transduction histidine kinase
MHAARIPNPAETDEAQASEPILAADGRGGCRSVLRGAGLSQRLAPRSSAARYGLVLIIVTAAYVTTIVVEIGTGKFSSFPFYAAVVAGAWLGVGPGLLSFALSSVAAADFWTPTRYNIHIDTVDLPSFAAFVVFALMSLAWSVQRRRAEHALEATVQQRTAELVRANEALRTEMAERAAAERALRDAEAELARTLRLATMAELAATIAHEVNQPLAAVTANGSACLRSLQRDPPLLDNAREAAACIVADGHRAGEVIARIRALFNKEPPREQLLDLNGVVEAVLALSRGASERQRVAVRAELADPPPLVRADPVQLQQVLVNLVANALEAMEDTPLAERAITVRSRVDGETAAVIVEDNGAGLDPDCIARMFDSFYTTKPGGIGVGLAISRSIIEAHGGSIWAAPGASRGAVVGFKLPLAALRAAR